MRKMTKTAAVLAAMSAMTVASASLAFADEPQLKNVTAIANNEEAPVGATSGSWKDEGKNGWTFTTEDGTKLKDTWAEIDGIWYYFDGTKVAQNRVLELDGDFYFFDQNGTMATGWQKITSEMDAYNDIELSDQLNDQAKDQKNDDYTYYDYVWCYFHEDGKAAVNEWKQSEVSGLWYWMDEMVMVHSNYAYVMDTTNYDDADSDKYDIYGFGKDGHMYVGWTPEEVKDSNRNTPTASNGTRWYYYASTGKMQKAGWKKLDDKWYLFAEDDGGNIDKYPVVMNAYVTSYPKQTSVTPEYFYVDSKGAMATSVTQLPDKVYIVDCYSTTDDDVVVDITYTDAGKVDTGKPYVYFGSNGAAKTGWVDGKYYATKTNDVKAVNGDVTKVSSSKSIYDAVGANTAATAVTGYTIYAKNGNTYYGALVKNAWVKSSTVALVDEDGDMYKNAAVMVGQVTYTLDGAPVTADAYVLLDRYGDAYTGYKTSSKTVNVSRVSYTATGENADDISLNIPNADKVSIFVKTK